MFGMQGIIYYVACIISQGIVATVPCLFYHAIAFSVFSNRSLLSNSFG